MVSIAQRLNIIGGGRVATTLAYLWSKTDQVEIGEILNRSLDSALQATQFIQAGKAIDTITDMQTADYYLIGCADNHIESCCDTLVASGLLNQRLSSPQKPQNTAIVFHCSGALSSQILASAREQGAYIASVHPIKSFASPESAIHNFAGTYCGVEGDEVAVTALSTLIQSIGGKTFAINAEHKTLYHAASVMACNYLVALEEISLQAFAQAGIDKTLGMKLLKPIVEETTHNIFTLDTTQALTGPIARGDDTVVAKQLEALTAWQPNVGELYRLLGQQALLLAQKQGNADQAGLNNIQALLHS